jgi:CheY-like chemotaxis protein
MTMLMTGPYLDALALANPIVRGEQAGNSEQALTYLHRIRGLLPDFIFLNINMPHISGWQYPEQLRREPAFQNIPVVLYSTSKNPEDKTALLLSCGILAP